MTHQMFLGFPGGSDGKKKKCLQCERLRFTPWVRKIPWRREWLPSPVFLPRESHGQRSLAVYHPWGHQESETTGRLAHYLYMCVSLQLCPTLFNPMNYSYPGSSVLGILHSTMMEWVAIPFSRSSSWLRDWTRVSCIAGEFFTDPATREDLFV